MIGNRIQRARKAAGISLRALAEQTGVSHTALNKFEHGTLTPSSAQLIKIGRVLGVRSEYFLRPDRVEVELEEIEYRKHSKTPKKVLDRITANVLDQAERWIELLDLYPVPPIRTFAVPDSIPEEISDYEQLEIVAERVREEWELGENPIPDLIDTLESQGLLVILTEIPPEARFDGLAGNVGEQHVIVVSKDISGDRQRLTLAHELGHRLLAGRLKDTVDEEKACQRFAGAFLLPARAVREHLGDHRRALEWRELYLLKREFGISMAAGLVRAAQAGIIGEDLKKRMFAGLRKHGWHKGEPGEPVKQESSVLFEQLVYRALAEDVIGQSKAAELLNLSASQFQKNRSLTETGTDAAAHQ
ncbi:ImmA/IrrE family metallo-endopeptidase [Aquisalimonas lutea]|uniref:helix-turn-helix domain-containing protein n=1 Tax=Aquisalimonas lutea TaxID=1327750 RepID=UPI0025B4A140|nr:XRE family transcriptional regulator [Aquisalimonas lutea]MDN3517026.1 ImmA/IrrE family metallo-endopeptidase [Aquisalimonas lutea]